METFSRATPDFFEDGDRGQEALCTNEAISTGADNARHAGHPGSRHTGKTTTTSASPLTMTAR